MSDLQEKQWKKVDNLLDGWLLTRQELIVLYCSLSGVNKFDPESTRLISRLRKFCQLLVDYVSAGHFEIYGELCKEAEISGDGSEKLFTKMYGNLTDTTQKALDFNDTFDKHVGKPATGALKNGLSKLGEILVNRFDMEDKLISELHHAHAPEPA